MSLVVNASEAMGDKPGIITITTGWMKCDKAYLDSTVPVCRVGFDKPMKQGIYAFLEVTDSGCGMDSDTQKRIFDPFFTTKFFGRGLGLAAVLGIIRSHRGGIKVYSEQGKGTTFKILFPASQNEKIAAARKVETEKKQPKAIATVLVVDDEEGVRNFALKCFERMGVTVLSASNGNEALEIFAKNWDKIDAVFLDFTMPGKSSEEVFRELKLMKPVIKVVLCSGYSEEQATARFLGKGLAGFMQKPYGMVALRERLFSLLPQERLQTNDPEHNNDKRQTDNPSE
jgi:CheY-like chemotaxis protein